jgi:uncharacterized protein (DUF1697 family)
MTNRYVAFLRAINVGGHTVKMDRLRDLVAALPVRNVSTFIASGNVLLESEAAAIHLEAAIELQLRKHLGYPVGTFIRTIPELQKVVDHDPFPGEDASLYVGFLKTKPAAGPVRTLTSASTEVDRFHLHGREVYWLARAGFSGSTFTGAKLEKMVGPMTMRNITTVRKLAAK